jgi:hypothetical protein
VRTTSLGGVGRWNGGLNIQEGYTIPGPYIDSPWGQELIEGTHQLVNDPAPLTGRPVGDRHPGGPYHVGYAGTIGGMSILAASVVGLFDPAGYYGDLPQSQQGIVAAVPPWERD